MFTWKRFKLKKREYVFIRKDILDDIIRDSIMVAGMISSNKDLDIHNVTVGEIDKFETNYPDDRYKRVVNEVIRMLGES